MGDKQGETRGDKTLAGDTRGDNRETREDKTLRKADTPSNKGKQEGRQGETRPSGRQTHHPTKGHKKGDKGRQDPREGGHTIQHQGGHLKKALRTPNSTLFGELKYK